LEEEAGAVAAEMFDAENFLALCESDPDAALGKISVLLKGAPGMGENYAILLFKALALGRKALLRYQFAGEKINEEIGSLSEASIREFCAARNAAEYQEEESYTEEVIVEPGGLFRKPKTRIETRKRLVTKSHFDFAPLASHFDSVSQLLERCAPGSVQTLTGEMKFRYILLSGWAKVPPIMEDALEPQDWRNLGEITLSPPFIVHSVVFSWAMGGDQIEVDAILFEKPPKAKPFEPPREIGSPKGRIRLQRSDPSRKKWVVKSSSYS